MLLLKLKKICVCYTSFQSWQTLSLSHKANNPSLICQCIVCILLMQVSLNLLPERITWAGIVHMKKSSPLSQANESCPPLYLGEIDLLHVTLVWNLMQMSSQVPAVPSQVTYFCDWNIKSRVNRIIFICPLNPLGDYLSRKQSLGNALATVFNSYMRLNITIYVLETVSKMQKNSSVYSFLELWLCTPVSGEIPLYTQVYFTDLRTLELDCMLAYVRKRPCD